MRVVAPGEVKQVEVLVLRSRDALHSHERHSPALHTGRLALNIVEVMEDFVLGIAHVGRVLQPVGLRRGTVVSEVLEVLH